MMTVVNNTSRSKRYFFITMIIALLVILLSNLWQKSYRSMINIWQVPPRPPVPQVLSVKDITELKWRSPQQAEMLAWTLQLGTFVGPNNTRRLVKRLRAHGYSAYTRNVVTDNGVVTKVYVGPQIKQDKLRTEATSIERNLHLKGTIMPFNVFLTG